MVNEEAEKFKQQGNDLFKEKKYKDAIAKYNKAVTADPDNPTYYSNRSACWSCQGNHESALADANRCLKTDPNFVKGYSRKGKAHFDLNQLDEAEAAYKEGLAKEPGNDACTKGLGDLADARRRPKGSSKSGSRAGAYGGIGGLGGGLVGQIIDKLKSGGRMQTYMMVMVFYFLFTNLSGWNKTAKNTDSMPDPVAEDDDSAQATLGTVSRKFKDLDGMWLSYMQSDSKSDTTLLLLHRTSLSAEAEFSAAFPRLASVKAVGGAARLIAPDRPCHGFSPCPGKGEPDDAAWLSRFIRSGGTPERMVVAAVGREAAALALSLAGKRKEVGHILFVSPKGVAPVRSKVTKAEDLHAWLKKNNYPASGQAAADAIRWAAAAGPSEVEAKRPLIALNPEKLPQDCRVTILYDTGDEEDDQLRQTLDAQGTETKTRSITGDDTLFDILAEEVQQALNPDTSEASGGDLEN